LNNMDNANYTNGIELQDVSGNVLFSFFHQGGDNSNGHFTDAAGSGTATGFTYNFQGFTSLTFTLNSSTTYTFTDNTTGANFSGTLSGAQSRRSPFSEQMVARPRVTGRIFSSML